MFETEPARLAKSDRTRARIRDAAVDSFMERGYAATTMRLVADRAGVSVGNAYYYFPSKDHLVQELYRRVQQEHGVTARAALQGRDGVVERLRTVIETGLAALQPYRHIAAGFLAAMIAPDSPINPLSAESAAARELTVELFREAVDGAPHRIPSDIAELLPEALFVAYLALVLRWTYDESPHQEHTAKLVSTGMRLLAVALPLMRMPVFHSISRDMLTLATEVRS